MKTDKQILEGWFPKPFVIMTSDLDNGAWLVTLTPDGRKIDVNHSLHEPLQKIFLQIAIAKFSGEAKNGDKVAQTHLEQCQEWLDKVYTSGPH